MAKRPCFRIVHLKESQSVRVMSDTVRLLYTSKMEAQNSLWQLRVSMSGSWGAGLASSTLGLVMCTGAQTRQWSDQRVGTVTGFLVVQVL